MLIGKRRKSDNLNSCKAIGHGDVVQLSVGNISSDCLAIRTDGDLLFLPEKTAVRLMTSLSSSQNSIQLTTSTGEKLDAEFDGVIPVMAIRLKLTQPKEEPVISPKSRGYERQSFRSKRDFSFDVSIDGKTWLNAHGKNIGEGGLMAIDPGLTDLAVGQELKVRIHPQGPAPIVLRTVVKRIFQYVEGAENSRAFAAQFLRLTTADTRALVQYTFYLQAMNNPLRKRLLD